jgi:HAD superfamily hydrolase (TIGR01509 family)
MKTILVDAIHAFVIQGEGIFEAMHALLETFDNPKIILTGANAGQMKTFGLDRMPYEVFTLGHDPEKSDPAYYRTMLAHFGLDSDAVVYFEHDPAAVESARSVGINTYHYDQDKQDLDALKKFLTDNL